MDRYPEFLQARQQLLAESTNGLLQELRTGKRSETVALPDITTSQPKKVTVIGEENTTLINLRDSMLEYGLAPPDLTGEIADPETGEVLVILDAHWPQGIQAGLSEKVALLLDHDSEMEARLGSLGYRFFTDIPDLWWYIEELVNVDIDGDGIVGTPGS